MVGSNGLCGICATRKRPPHLNHLLVGSNGLEPSTSRLSGVCSNQLSYEPVGTVIFTSFGIDVWWRLAGSNRWPPACRAGALPAELNPRKQFRSIFASENRNEVVFVVKRLSVRNQSELAVFRHKSFKNIKPFILTLKRNLNKAVSPIMNKTKAPEKRSGLFIKNE